VCVLYKREREREKERERERERERGWVGRREWGWIKGAPKQSGKKEITEIDM
jgi:hypothetical protein